VGEAGPETAVRGGKYAAGSLRLVDQFGGQALAASIHHLLISTKGAGLLFCDSTGMYWNRMPLMDFLKEPADIH
jgi:hypothetical protein